MRLASMIQPAPETAHSPCHRSLIEGSHEPEQRSICDSLQALHSSLESKISTKVLQICTS